MVTRERGHKTQVTEQLPYLQTCLKLDHLTSPEHISGNNYCYPCGNLDQKMLKCTKRSLKTFGFSSLELANCIENKTIMSFHFFIKIFHHFLFNNMAYTIFMYAVDANIILASTTYNLFHRKCAKLRMIGLKCLKLTWTNIFAIISFAFYKIHAAITCWCCSVCLLYRPADLDLFYLAG